MQRSCGAAVLTINKQFDGNNKGGLGLARGKRRNSQSTKPSFRKRNATEADETGNEDYQVAEKNGECLDQVSAEVVAGSVIEGVVDEFAADDGLGARTFNKGNIP
jgi:hypothetical protein